MVGNPYTLHLDSTFNSSGSKGYVVLSAALHPNSRCMLCLKPQFMLGDLFDIRGVIYLNTKSIGKNYDLSESQKTRA